MRALWIAVLCLVAVGCGASPVDQEPLGETHQAVRVALTNGEIEIINWSKVQWDNESVGLNPYTPNAGYYRGRYPNPTLAEQPNPVPVYSTNPASSGWSAYASVASDNSYIDVNFVAMNHCVGATWEGKCRREVLHAYGKYLGLANLAPPGQFGALTYGQYTAANGDNNEALPVHLWPYDLAFFDMKYPYDTPPGPLLSTPGSPYWALLSAARSAWNIEATRRDSRRYFRRGMPVLSDSTVPVYNSDRQGGLGYADPNNRYVVINIAAMGNCVSTVIPGARWGTTYEGRCRMIMMHEYGHVLRQIHLEEKYPTVYTIGVMESGPSCDTGGDCNENMPVHLWPQDLQQLDTVYPFVP